MNDRLNNDKNISALQLTTTTILSFSAPFERASSATLDD
jgi:hypothetical protein